MRRASDAHGFVAVEWVAAAAFLLLPIVVLVASLPAWAERRHVATVAAREAARTLANDWPRADTEAASAVAQEVASRRGVHGAHVHIRSVGSARGSDIRVEVDVSMPAIGVAGMRAGTWRYTAVAVRRVEDFRSR
jgi:hypothetical protein